MKEYIEKNKKYILIGAAVVFAFILFCFISGQNMTVEMPDLVGLNLTEAEEQLKNSNITKYEFSTVDESGNAVQQAGDISTLVVVKQNFKPGDKVKFKRETIKLECFDGIGKYTALLEGKSLKDIVKTLKNEPYDVTYYDDSDSEFYKSNEIDKLLNNTKYTDYEFVSVTDFEYMNKSMTVNIYSKSREKEYRKTQEKKKAISELGEYSNVIESIEIEAKEEGVTYWAVTLKDGVDWNGDYYSEQTDICKYAVRKCISQTDSMKKDLDTCAVTGYKGNGDYAFSWGYPFGHDKYTLYDDNQKMWNYNIIDYDDWGMNSN